MNLRQSTGFGILFLGLSLTSLADSGRMASVVKNPLGLSYFDVTIKDSGLLEGSYKGWCGDWSAAIGEGILYDVKYYSSYSELPDGLVDHPENLDEVNWIINKKFVKKKSPTVPGVYTRGDVQLAIWTMLDDSFDASTVGPFSQARVNEIVMRATQEGSGYIPKCRDQIGIILDPTDPQTGAHQQSVITEVPRKHFPKCSVPDDAL
jgi:hypothetical protein